MPDAEVPRAPRDVYCYFDNTDKLHAPKNARRLMQMLDIQWEPAAPSGCAVRHARENAAKLDDARKRRRYRCTYGGGALGGGIAALGGGVALGGGIAAFGGGAFGGGIAAFRGGAPT